MEYSTLYLGTVSAKRPKNPRKTTRILRKGHGHNKQIDWKKERQEKRRR